MDLTREGLALLLPLRQQAAVGLLKREIGAIQRGNLRRKVLLQLGPLLAKLLGLVAGAVVATQRPDERGELLPVGRADKSGDDILAVGRRRAEIGHASSLSQDDDPLRYGEEVIKVVAAEKDGGTLLR